MSENPIVTEQPERPILEETAEIGAQRISNKTGKPVILVLDEAERQAEQNELPLWKNIYKKVKNRLAGN